VKPEPENGRLVREFRVGDELALYEVFRSAVHMIAVHDYTAEQLAVWAPERPDVARWTDKMRAIRPFVVEEAGAILGYADLQPSGYIDHFYVAGSHGGRGVGRALMSRIHEGARALKLAQLSSDVSLTAEPFFRRFGFRVVERRVVETAGVRLRNARMVKDLGAN